MIKKIIKDFRSGSSFKGDNEVALFRKFAKAVEKNSKSTFIDETHGGNVCNVSFSSATGKKETCEIADLLIVTLQPNTSEMRATFWQAKKQSISKWMNVTNTGSQLDFKGQFNQWDLLSRRPSIQGVKSFSPPKDLLQSFQSPSIGTFGIFYEKNNDIEIAHSIAEFISCPSPAAKHPTLSINGYLSKYKLNIHEAISELDLASFLGSLMAFGVGALLDNSNISHQWLVSRVRQKVAEKIDVDYLGHIDEFLNNDVANNIGYEGFDSGLSILFVVAESQR